VAAAACTVAVAVAAPAAAFQHSALGNCGASLALGDSALGNLVRWQPGNSALGNLATLLQLCALVLTPSRSFS
jgi:hypothetical protein